MVRRRRIIAVRLLPHEVEAGEALMKHLRLTQWSELLRQGIQIMLAKFNPPRPITTLNNRSDVKQAMPLFDRKTRKKTPARKGRKTRQKVA